MNKAPVSGVAPRREPNASPGCQPFVVAPTPGFRHSGRPFGTRTARRHEAVVPQALHADGQLPNASSTSPFSIANASRVSRVAVTGAANV